MRLDPGELAPFTISARLRRLPRIIAARHAATPASTGHGTSRFSSPSRSFRTLYAAGDFETAFAEAVIRDRFEGRQRRIIYQSTLETYAVTEIHSTRALTLLDLTGDHSYRLGIDTDAVRGRAHQPGQLFAEALVEQIGHDGILFSSRLTGVACVALFETALPDLGGSPAVPLLRVAALPAELKRLNVILRRRRGP
ncbi:MAG TPA: RES family NAD+ phosphorylase [Allosphingosinicella sp.]